MASDNMAMLLISRVWQWIREDIIKEIKSFVRQKVIESTEISLNSWERKFLNGQNW